MKLKQRKILAKTDPVLETIIARINEPVIISTKNIFHDLLSCIIEQQIHYRSTKKIFAKALDKAGIQQLNLENFYLLEKYSLPHLKLSMGKYETMVAFIEYWSNHSFNYFELTDDAIINELSSIKGIGKWTIDMILLYTLGRPNIFPYDDFHLKQIMISLYQLDPNVKLKASMLNIAEQWGEQKSLAVLYLLAYKTFKTAKKLEG